MPFRRFRQSIFISFLKSKIWLPKNFPSHSNFGSQRLRVKDFEVFRKCPHFILTNSICYKVFGDHSLSDLPKTISAIQAFPNTLDLVYPGKSVLFFNFKTVKRVKVFIHLKAAHHSPMVNHHQARRAWSLRCLSERGGKCININFRPKLSCVRVALEILETF